MGVQTFEGDHIEMALFRQWVEKLKLQSTVNNQNTEDDLAVLLRILSILNTILHYYFPHPVSRPGRVCLDNV
jgi:hypothetical protein